MKKVQVYLEEPAFARLTALARENRRTLSDYCRIVIEEHIDSLGDDPTDGKGDN